MGVFCFQIINANIFFHIFMDNLFAEDRSMLSWLISMSEVHIKNLSRL